MPTVEQVKNKVLRLMAKAFKITTTDDETILLWHESAACSVKVEEFDPDEDGQNTVVKVSAPILWNVKRTPVLYEWVATSGQAYMFGRVACNISSQASETNLEFEYNLLGDNLDESELITTVTLLLGTANDLDDELQKKFGGKKTSDL
ncbi:MAG: T3SS (YopN, CesT) and YbjN peptide-binding chaperone 1 [Roseiflexaceae bacterium]